MLVVYLVFGVRGSEFGVLGSEFGVLGSEFGVLGSEFWVLGSGLLKVSWFDIVSGLRPV